MNAARWLRLAAWGAFVLVGLLLAWREPPAEVLFGPEGWHASGGFVELSPPTKELRRSAADDPRTRYWRSWSPEQGNKPGLLYSDPFHPGGPIGVPYNGFAGDAGVQVFIECAGSGERRYLATSRTNTQWAEVVVDTRPWCDGAIRLVASSESSQTHVSLGTPYRLGWQARFKHSALAQAWFLVVAWATVCGVFLAGARHTPRTVAMPGALVAGLVAVGLFGYLWFFAFWFAHGPARWIAALAVVLAAASAARQLASPARGSVAEAMRWPLLAWGVVALGFLAFGLLGDNGAGPWMVNGRFTPVRWSTDNQIPGMVARILVSGDAWNAADFGPWKISDRPPLSYGWHAVLHDFFQLMLGRGASRPLFASYQLATGVVLNSLWVVPVAVMLPRLGLARDRVVALLLVLSTCAFFLFNDLYVWPKLLAGTFALASCWLLLAPGDAVAPLRQSNGDLVLAAVMAALALMTHGGSVFGIAVAVAMAPFVRGMPSPRGAIVAALAALAILLPWSAWQHLVQPPGNALVKFAFAGTFGWGEEHLGVGETILRSYATLDPAAWAQRKLDGLWTLVAGARNTCGVGEAGVVFSAMDASRLGDFLHVFPSLNALLAGFAAVLLARRDDAASRAGRRLVAYATLTIAATWLLTWDCHINHHQAYQALVALHLGLALLLLQAGRWGWWVLAANVAYGAIVWGIEPLAHMPRLDPVAATLLLAVLGVAWRAFADARAAAA